MKICGINLTAYSVVLVMMMLLSVCSKSYGQENYVLSFDRAKQTVTGIDTTKLSIYEYGKSFLSPHFDTIPPMPETLLDFRPDYTRSFPVDRSSLHKGEYNVGGIIHRFDKVDVWGRGRQENIIGVGVSNYAEVKTVYSPNEKWKLGLCLYAHKLSIPRSGSNTFGIGTDVSCQFLPPNIAPSLRYLLSYLFAGSKTDEEAGRLPLWRLPLIRFGRTVGNGRGHEKLWRQWVSPAMVCTDNTSVV